VKLLGDWGVTVDKDVVSTSASRTAFRAGPATRLVLSYESQPIVRDMKGTARCSPHPLARHQDSGAANVEKLFETSADTYAKNNVTGARSARSKR